jgi:hypothetical protein
MCWASSHFRQYHVFIKTIVVGIVKGTVSCCKQTCYVFVKLCVHCIFKITRTTAIGYIAYAKIRLTKLDTNSSFCSVS